MQEITKDLNPEKISEKTLLGEQIVLGRPRGRPITPYSDSSKRVEGWYPDKVKEQAAVIYAASGTMSKVSEILDVPITIIKHWMQESWWQEIVDQVHQEENDKITAKKTELINKTLNQIEDRINNGDTVVTKQGLLKLPPKLRDLAHAENLLIEKRQLLRGEATKRVETLSPDKYLIDLAAQFKKFAQSKQIEGTYEIIQTETVSSTEEGS